MKRIIGFNLIGQRCDYVPVTGGQRCTREADSIFRHKPTGAVVSARCKAHDTPTRRIELDAGRCPTCRLDRTDHYNEDANTYSCDTAIDRAAASAESNLPA